jgi:ATP-dependent DNA helicase RecQ
LEFDHVAVLDGGWDKIDRDGDKDAPRRLYYVAMTRARKTLTLSQFGKKHPILDSTSKKEAFLFRDLSPRLALSPELARQYKRVTLRDVDLGFAGRRIDGDPLHREIAGLNTGDNLALVRVQDKWVLQSETGTVVGRLARSFDPPKRMRCISATVAAIVQRRREDTDDQFQNLVRCDRWEIVVPDLVFEPES